jgi:hypothetical protein
MSVNRWSTTPSAGDSQRQFYLKFDAGFETDGPAHHVSRRDVERALRWPRWVDELTAGADLAPSETVTAWVASPPMIARRDPSVLLVVTRQRRTERRVHDAWRLYLSDIDLRQARSGGDVLSAFLDRYGLDVQLGAESQRLFLPRRVSMGAEGNASVRIGGSEPAEGARVLEVFRLNPERVEIEVGVAFAVNEHSFRADVARHEPPPGERRERT